MGHRIQRIPLKGSLTSQSLSDIVGAPESPESPRLASLGASAECPFSLLHTNWLHTGAYRYLDILSRLTVKRAQEV